VSRNDTELERVKAHLTALSESLPELIERVRAQAEGQGPLSTPLPDADKERERLAGFATYLDHYGRVDSRGIGPLEVREVLDEAVALTRGEIGQKARLQTSYLPAPIVRANPRQLGQVFVSLLINAAQALPSGSPDVNRVDIELDTSEAGWARVAIADTGAGITPEVLPHIFDALYSTKRGAGMGIGLAIVREIVEGLGGRISVESAPGRGTLFILELPPEP